jgi:hypothetical protein
MKAILEQSGEVIEWIKDTIKKYENFEIEINKPPFIIKNIEVLSETTKPEVKKVQIIVELKDISKLLHKAESSHTNKEYVEICKRINEEANCFRFPGKVIRSLPAFDLILRTNNNTAIHLVYYNNTVSFDPIVVSCYTLEPTVLNRKTTGELVLA